MKQPVIGVLQAGSSFVHMFSLRLCIQLVCIEGLWCARSILGAGNSGKRHGPCPAGACVSRQRQAVSTPTATYSNIACEVPSDAT